MNAVNAKSAEIGSKARRITALVCIAVLIGSVIWIAWANKALVCTEYIVKSERLPNAFDGFCIAQVSDLHNDVFGEGNADLLKLLDASKPDIIALTGDLIDSYDTDMEIAVSFVEEALKIAPCYYVTGNHEGRVENWKQLLEELEQLGVTVLYDECIELECNGQKIVIAGVNDPKFETYASLQSVLSDLMEEDGFTVLLSHRPELFDDYVTAGVDLVLTGHAHGGQFRVPFAGGLYSPDQGIFPEYDCGVYQKNGTAMVVSRGLGNSAFPFRLNNRPELVVVRLESQ